MSQIQNGFEDSKCEMITERNPEDIENFIKACLGKLKEVEKLTTD